MNIFFKFLCATKVRSKAVSVLLIKKNCLSWTTGYEETSIFCTCVKSSCDWINIPLTCSSINEFKLKASRMLYIYTQKNLVERNLLFFVSDDADEKILSSLSFRKIKKIWSSNCSRLWMIREMKFHFQPPHLSV